MVRIRSLTTSPAPEYSISTSGTSILTNGSPTKFFGIRAASAAYNQSLTDKLIAAIPEYVSYGMNCFTVFMQGSSGGHQRGWDASGNIPDAGVIDRMKQIASVCKANRALLIAGLYYQKASRLSTSAAYTAGALSFAEQMLPWKNSIIINIANENNSSGWVGAPVNFNSAESLLQICAAIKNYDSSFIVGGGGYGKIADGDYNTSTLPLLTDQRADVLLFDTLNTTTMGYYYSQHVSNGLNKPAINVETFGGSTKDIPGGPGEYDSAWKTRYLQDLSEAKSNGSSGTLFHDNKKFQTYSLGGSYTPDSTIYAIGGYGNSGDPGIRWYADAVKS